MIGFLYATLAALGFALWNLFMQRALQRGAGVSGYLFILSLVTAILGLPIFLFQMGVGSHPPINSAGLIYFILAGVMVGALGPFHATQATVRIGSAQTTSIRLLDPFFAFVIGLLFLAETISGQVMAGVTLIVVALGLLQRSQQRPEPREAAGRPVRGLTGAGAGLLFAIGASVFFTVGSAFRKAGLNEVPSPILSVTMEGVMGLLIIGSGVALGRRWGEVRAAFSPGQSDIWLSSLSAALATLCLNLALQQLPLPIAVALRNTSPWFALLLGPVLLGNRHKTGWPVWLSTLLLTLGMLLILSRQT